MDGVLKLATVLPLTVRTIHQHLAPPPPTRGKGQNLNRIPNPLPRQKILAIRRRRPPRLQRRNAVAVQRRTETGEESIVPQAREADGRRRRRTEGGAQGGRAPERGRGGHSPLQKALSAIPQIRLAERDCGPGPKTGGDLGKYVILLLLSTV